MSNMRVWRGVMSQSKVDNDLGCLEETGLTGNRPTPGNLDVRVRRWVRNSTAEFLLLAEWDCIDAVRAFAAEHVDRAVYYARDPELLLEFEPEVDQYDVLCSRRRGRRTCSAVTISVRCSGSGERDWSGRRLP